MRAPLAVLATLVALAAGAGMHCAQRREISPCSCRRSDTGLQLLCERIGSFARIAEALRGRFPLGTHAALTITHSDISDLRASATLADLGLSLPYLHLNHDNISELDDAAFVGLRSTEYLSLADNELSSVPRHVLRHMPNLKTLDLARSKIKMLVATDLMDLSNVNFLTLAGNGMVSIEKDSLPSDLRHLNLGSNQLTTLNGTLRNLNQLEILMIHSNKLTTIENEIPMNKIKMIQAAHNHLESLPKEIRHMPMLDALYYYHNQVKTLNGALQKSKKLEMLNLSFNEIKHLARDDFMETKTLTNLDLGYNHIQCLNGSLRNLPLLRYLNLTHNELVQFSLQEIQGSKELVVADLSHNKISHLTRNTENIVDIKTRVLELRLSYNKLRSLEGALTGLRGLMNLNVSHNFLEVLSADDLIGLDELRVLDISHNHITTLEETSKTFLPALEELHASYNKITILDKDFHGLPVLCHADLSHNDIEVIKIDLVLKTRCLIHGVKGTLKVHLYDNPVLCDENYPELNEFMDKFHEKLHARFYGECMSQKSIMVSNVVSLDGFIGKNAKMIGVDSKLVQIITGKNGEPPILVYPPITLPPSTPSTTPSPQSNHRHEVQYLTKVTGDDPSV